MKLDTVVTRNPNAAYRVYDGQATIVLPDQAEVNVINEIGSLVWERIDGKKNLGELVESILKDYEVTREQAEKDVIEFVTSLKAHEMVE